MSRYFLAPAAVQLRDEINARYPTRDKSSDGWIGDPSHAARKSEHNPCWTCEGRLRGIVLAIDIDIDDNTPGDLRREIIRECVGDPRVWYVISNGVIYSRTYDWRPRRYLGSNPHTKHVHVSFRASQAFGTARFFSDPKAAPKPRSRAPYLDISKLRAEFLRVVDEGREPRGSVDVRRFQRLCNARLSTKLVVDGQIGPATLRAAGELERRFGGSGRPRVPDSTTLIRANRGAFRVVP